MGAFADLEAAIDDVAEQKAGLDAEYAEQRADIESAYELSETAEERAALDQLLERLDAERDRAVDVLGRGYDRARADILQRQHAATGAAEAEIERMASTFEQTYARIAESERAVAARNERAGVPTGGVQRSSAEGATARAFAGMAAAEQARNAISQEDMAWMADSLNRQRMSSISDAQNTAMRVGGRLTGEHNARVSDRINQERMLQADALQNLGARFDQRRDGLLGRHGDLVGQLESMREQRRQFDAQLAEQQAARRAAAARAASAGGASGPTAGGLAVSDDGLSSLADMSRLGRVPAMLADRAGETVRSSILDRVVPGSLRAAPSRPPYRDSGPSAANQSTAGTRFYR